MLLNVDQELKYTMGQMLNAQRTAALALVTPNLSCLYQLESTGVG